MSKTFGKLFGSPSASYQNSSTPTAYQSLSPQQLAAYNASIATGTNLAANPSNFAPAPINAQQQQAASYFGTPIQSISPDQLNAGISMFSNPFTQQVIQNTNNEIQRNLQSDISNNAQMADAAGGFGGTRQAIMDSEAQRNALLAEGYTAADLNNQNFNNAVGNTLSQYNTANALTQANMGNLANLGGQFEQIQTGINQAPVAANSYLAQLAAMLSGGGQSVSGTAKGASPGIINQIGNGMGSLSRIFGGLGSLAAMV